MSASRIASLVVILAYTLVAAACANTVRGVGQDVKGTAKAVEDAAQ